MNLLFLTSSFFFFLWVIRNTLFWTNLWQTKEYRFDRLLVHFTETAKGKEILFSPLSWLKWFVLVGYVIPIFYDYTLPVYNIIVSFLLFIDAAIVIREIAIHRLRRPVFTARAVLVILGTLIFVSILFIFPFLDTYAWILILNKAISVIVFFWVVILSIPSDLIIEYVIEKAKKQMQKNKNVMVIGVSGSYGKSSTKEYIAQILGTKFKIAKTEGSHNTPIGIAQTILKKVQKDTQIFVVELGSYKKGEVQELCQIVGPQISVTTSISDQHLSLYGSFKNIEDTEKELIDSIPRGGISLFNGNDKGALHLFKKTRKKKILFKIVDDKNTDLTYVNEENMIFAKKIYVRKNGSSFEIAHQGKTIHFETTLLGRHAIENILPGIFLAWHLGITTSQIKRAVSTLTPLPKTMISYTLKNSTVIIDDTFNASPESVIAALDYMKLYSQTKMLILEPLIELGENAQINHYKLGKKISGACNYLFLTNNNFYSSIYQGIKDGEGNCQAKVASVNEMVSFIQNTIKKGDVVLFEGREPSLVLSKILEFN